MQFQLQFITDELPQTPVHINQRTAVRGVIHYQNKILMVQYPTAVITSSRVAAWKRVRRKKKHCFGRSRRMTGYTDIHIGVKIGETFEQNIDTRGSGKLFSDEILLLRVLADEQ